MAGRAVTELDFRKPEYRDAKVEDYEFRADGALVRKDRWEVGIRTICGLVGMSDRDFEIPDVVSKVEQLATHQEGWMAIEDMEDSDDYPAESVPVSIQLSDSSILRGFYSLHRMSGCGGAELQRRSVRVEGRKR